MKKVVIFIFSILSLGIFAQSNQSQLEFSKEAVDLKNYHIYVENPTKQLRSFKVTVKGKNIKSDQPFIMTDTIGPETKRLIYVIRKEKKRRDALIGYTWIEAVGSVHVRKTLGHKYKLPYERGKSFKVIQGYSGRFSHEGTMALDFAMPEGTAVHAIRSGQIFAIKLDGNEGCPDKRCERFSNYIKILHYDGTIAVYKNLLPNCTSKRVGDFVNEGDRIARSGYTGMVNEPNLHVEVQKLSRDLSRYESVMVEFTLSASGKSDVLNLGDEYIRY